MAAAPAPVAKTSVSLTSKPDPKSLGSDPKKPSSVSSHPAPVQAPLPSSVSALNVPIASRSGTAVPAAAVPAAAVPAAAVAAVTTDSARRRAAAPAKLMNMTAVDTFVKKLDHSMEAMRKAVAKAEADNARIAGEKRNLEGELAIVDKALASLDAGLAAKKARREAVLKELEHFGGDRKSVV